MINKVILMGRLTADPELKQTQSGIAFCKFTVAINRPKQKDKEQEADFISVTAWRNTAEFVAKYFAKGKMIIVEGSLRNNNYTDNNGVKHYSMDVLADSVNFGESKNVGSNQPQTAPQNTYQPQTAQPQFNNPQYNYNGYQPQPVAPVQQGFNPLNMGGVAEFAAISDGDVPF